LWLVNHQVVCAEIIHKLEVEYGIDGQGRLKILLDGAITKIQPIHNTTELSCGYCAVVKENSSSKALLIPYLLLIGANDTHSAI
jgi:hypothetical protein